MKNLLFLCVLFLSCGKPVYKQPVIGMSYVDFIGLCGVGLRDDSNSVTNTQGTTFTVVLKSPDDEVVYGSNKAPSNRNDKECVGAFTFVNGKLDSISR